MVFFYPLCCLLLCLHSIGHAANGVILKENPSGFSLEIGATFLEDVEGKLTIDDILLKNNRLESWRLVNDNSASFGFSQSAFWIKQHISNRNPNNSNWIIAMNYSPVDWVDVYYAKDQSIIQAFHTGDMLPFQQRPIENRNFLFPLTLEQNDSITLYVRIQSAGNIKAPLRVWAERDHQGYSETLISLQAAFVGALLVMAFYNGFLFLSIRDSSYAHYIGFILCELLVISQYNGFNYQYLWPKSPGLNTVALPFFMSGLVFFGSNFINTFLKLKTTAPLHNKIATGLSIVAILSLVASLIVEYRIIITIVIGIITFAIIYAFYVSARLWQQGHRAARFVTIAWGALLASGFLLLLSVAGVIQGSVLIDGAVPICAILEVSLLSIALGDRINEERNAKMFVQQALTETQRQANSTLERSVLERTKELEIANEKLTLINTLDPLTGLRNRRFFSDHLVQEYKRAHRSEEPIAAFMVDIDHFKNVNDTYGHQAGDECIIAVANALTSVVKRPCDAIARYGGEEFAIILPNTPFGGAAIVAEGIRAAVEALNVTFDGKDIMLTVSIGIHSAIPSTHSDGEDSIALADKALYKAKETGRNCVVCSNVS